MNLDFRFYWSLFLRRFPMMALFLILCAGLGVITAMKLPATYTSSARLLVEAPQISEEILTSTVRNDAVEQLDIIQQKLLTRANLIDIANRLNVYTNLRQMEPDQVVEAMERDTSIRRSAGRNEATLMTIGFTARSGQIARGVVDEYVTLVRTENAKSRMNQAEKTLEFFAREVDSLGLDLDRKSADIVAFKSENAAALPEDQSYRLSRQTLLQERASRLEREISAAEAQRRDVVKIFESTGRIGGPRGQQTGSPQQQELIVARAELQNALTVYSETNPRVTRLQARVDRLEAIVSAQTAAGTPADGEATTPEQALFAATVSEIDNRLDTMQAERDAAAEELVELQGAISNSSANGIRLAALERDFASTQGRYDQAVSNLNQARLGERIETTAQGQRISVIENANVPQVPTGPNRPKIMAAGAAAGLALAAAWFALLEFLNRSIRRPAEITSRFNITPIATIPYMESRLHKLLRRSALVAATLVVLIGVPVALWYVDTYYLPLDIVVQKGLDKLGLG